MRVIVATFPTEASAALYRDALRAEFHVEDSAVSTGTIGAYGEPYDGDRLVAAWVRRELEPDVCRLAETRGGLLHDQSHAVVVPRWVQDVIAARPPGER